MGTRLTDRFVVARKNGESFRQFIARIGKSEVRKLLDDLTRPPEDSSDRSFFRDWNAPREYSLGDLGVGECAGEVVSSADFGLAAAERQVFEAQLELESGDFKAARQTAYQSMLEAAKALVKAELGGVSDDPGEIIREFRARFYDTRKFYDPFAGGKFAHYLFAAQGNSAEAPTPEKARHLIEEAQLFIEASHNYSNRAEAPVAV